MNPYVYAKNNIMLAPLAGYTDLAFRKLCAKLGAGLTFTEMVSAKGLHYNSEHTKELLNVSEEEGKAGVQLFGSDPTIMADIAARLEQTDGEHIALFDINMGCPAPKIVNNGEGSSLMRKPELAAEIVRSIYRMFISGTTTNAIARILTNKGIPTPAGKQTDFS